MNLLLLQLEDYIARQVAENGTVTGIAEVQDNRRANHMIKILKVEVGSTVKVGEADGLIGEGIISEIKLPEQVKKPTIITIKVKLTDAPPPPAPVRLIIALTRSKNFPKLLETVTVLGVKEIFVINTERVEPGYWHTHTLERDHIRQRLTEGLEQAVDTVYPRVVLCKKWDRFVSNTLPQLAKDYLSIVAHPDDDGISCPVSVKENTNLAIGPEGGFIDAEIEVFQEAGFKLVTLGSRILPVQAAVHVLLGKLCFA
eukprot:m.31784 g.31784  ORF g.31784 m.31784 type:complete len:256 (-) comp8350_c0_seq1:2984-3751(-)